MSFFELILQRVLTLFAVVAEHAEGLRFDDDDGEMRLIFLDEIRELRHDLAVARAQADLYDKSAHYRDHLKHIEGRVYDLMSRLQERWGGSEDLHCDGDGRSVQKVLERALLETRSWIDYWERYEYYRAEYQNPSQGCSLQEKHEEHKKSVEGIVAATLEEARPGNLAAAFASGMKKIQDLG